MSLPRKLEALDWRAVEHLCRQLHTSQRELDWICGNRERFYRRHVKIGKNGKRRELATPKGRLREILDELHTYLQRLEMPAQIHGGIRGRSTELNAKAHVNKAVLVKLDLKDYFPSISDHLVRALFRRLGCTAPVAQYLTLLTTLDGRLPQGSPTSMIIGAIASVPLAERLQELAEQHGASYTQYVDDIAISGPVHLVKLRPLVYKIIEQAGFQVNLKPSKNKVRYSNQEQEVTGLRVNKGLDSPRAKLDEAGALLDAIAARLKDGLAVDEKEIRSTRGKIAYIERYNRGAGRFLRKRLDRMFGATSCLHPPS